MAPDTSPLISILISVYNEERFLDYCLQSVTQQTYTHLQIVVVDDGSKDRSGEIADGWAQKDERIIVIHQSNGGISRARNRSLEVAQGEYITFVDSDDWISPNHIEELYRALVETDSEMASCGLMHHTQEGTFIKKTNTLRQRTVWSQPRALCELVFNKTLSSHLHNKLFARKLWDGIRFPDGKVYEDFFVMPLLLDRITRHVHNGLATMHYRRHDSSITRTLSTKNLLDYFEAQKERYLFIKNNPLFNRLGLENALVLYPQKALIKTQHSLEKRALSDTDKALVAQTISQLGAIRFASCHALQMLHLSIQKRRLEHKIRTTLL